MVLGKESSNLKSQKSHGGEIQRAWQEFGFHEWRGTFCFRKRERWRSRSPLVSLLNLLFVFLHRKIWSNKPESMENKLTWSKYFSYWMRKQIKSFETGILGPTVKFWPSIQEARCSCGKCSYNPRSYRVKKGEFQSIWEQAGIHGCCEILLEDVFHLLMLCNIGLMTQRCVAFFYVVCV